MKPKIPSSKLSEKVFTKSILNLARMLGWRTAHFHDSRRQVKPGVFVGDRDAAGFPDLVLVRPPRIIFAELKTDTGKATQKQKEWLLALDDCACASHGLTAVYLWRPAMIVDIERILRR